jgi:hypothetical protein
LWSLARGQCIEITIHLQDQMYCGHNMVLQEYDTCPCIPRLHNVNNFHVSSLILSPPPVPSILRTRNLSYFAGNTIADTANMLANKSSLGSGTYHVLSDSIDRFGQQMNRPSCSTSSPPLHLVIDNNHVPLVDDQIQWPNVSMDDNLDVYTSRGCKIGRKRRTVKF